MVSLERIVPGKMEFGCARPSQLEAPPSLRTGALPVSAPSPGPSIAQKGLSWVVVRGA